MASPLPAVLWRTSLGVNQLDQLQQIAHQKRWRVPVDRANSRLG